MDNPNPRFRAHLATHLPPLVAKQPGVAERIRPILDRCLAIVLIDFEPVRDILEGYYSHRKGGRPPRDPTVLLRSLTLMLMLGLTSINKWVERLKGEVELRVLCGLLPDEGIGVGTFYGFLHRILDGNWQPRCAHARPPSERVRGRAFLRNLDKDKQSVKAETQAEMALRDQGRVAVLVDKALERKDLPSPDDFIERLNELLMRCAIVPSAIAGLLGDLKRLVICGDGTTFPAATNGDGRRLCDCRTAADGKPTCDCLRKYSAPDGAWGYDTKTKSYFFGYRIHDFATRGRGDVDLPLHVSIAAANTPDVVAGVDALERLRKRLAMTDIGAVITQAIYDAGYDALAFYKLHHKLGIQTLIPLAQPSKTPTDAAGIARDAEGRPLCPAGLPMRLHQRTADQTVLNCPCKRPGRDQRKLVFKVHPEECPRGVLCEPDTKMGPIWHLRTDGDPRLNPVIPRGSELYKLLYKHRTASERYHSSLKSKGQADRGAYRREHFALAAAIVHAIGLHAGAWVTHLLGAGRPKTVAALLDWLAPSEAQPTACAA